MDQQQPEQTADAGSTESRTMWARPQVERFIAGSAEGASDISTDGVDIPS